MRGFRRPGSPKSAVPDFFPFSGNAKIFNIIWSKEKSSSIIFCLVIPGTYQIGAAILIKK